MRTFADRIDASEVEFHKIDPAKRPVVVAVLDVPGDGLAHLILKGSAPIALCGFRTTEVFGTSAPAMDRCVDCLRIARERNLGRPGWDGR